VYTHGCICGSFDASDCIAEQMVKIDNFAAAFVGNSRYGWFNEGQTEGPSGHIHREFMNALYHGIGTVHYTPFVYHPKSGELNYYRQVSLVIKTKKTKKAQAALQLLNSNNNESVAQFVENPNDLKSYPQTASSKSSNYDYLIITPEEFVSEFDVLVQHYLIRGMKTVVKNKEEILAEMDGQDAQEKIRNYIIQEYTANNVSYVMLGGDVEYIPYRGFYCAVQSSSVYEDDNIPSDLYYSALDGNWNTDEDNKWGEIGEDDLLPEMAVARFSFSNTTELSSMLNKTTNYQSNPVLGNFERLRKYIKTCYP